MTAEEMPLPTSSPADDASHGGHDPIDDPRALQILSTEHWSLLAGRSLSYNETFTRTGMFLTFLSASLIVVGFLVASDRFADAVIPIVILLLAVNLWIGLATLGRVFAAGIEEFAAVRGMNRIRHAYAEMIPGIERYFITSIHDDPLGAAISAYSRGRQLRPLSPVGNFLHGQTTVPGMLTSIDSVLFAALISVIALGLGATFGLALALGIAGLVGGFIAFNVWGYRTWTEQGRSGDPMFPSPPRSPKDAPPES
jgi:hypothetical protein